MMKRIGFLFILFLCVSCSQAPVKEEVKPSDEPFTMDLAVEKFENKTREIYMPDLKNMYDGKRFFYYNAQVDKVNIRSEYSFDENEDTEVYAYVSEDKNTSFWDNIKEYRTHILDKFFGKSERINQDGFTGYYKEDDTFSNKKQLEIKKDGYFYHFSAPDKKPEGYEDFNFAEITIDSMKIANDFEELDLLQSTILDAANFPSTDLYDYLQVEFSFDYAGDNYLLLDFSDDTRNNQLIVSDAEFDVLPILDNWNTSNIKDLEKKNHSIELANGQEVNLSVFKEKDKETDAIQVLYEWKKDGLYYSLHINDYFVNSLKQLEEELENYENLIEEILEEQ